MQLLRTILIIIIVYYLVKLFARYVLPVLAKYFIRKATKNMQKNHDKPKRKVGDINIDYMPEKKQTPDDLGEYIDYEDVKE